jgi:hypothetical protein
MASHRSAVSMSTLTTVELGMGVTVEDI